MYIPKSPLMLGVELTSRCNLHCPHCVADADWNGESLPYDTAISVIDEAHQIGIKELIFGGGEVLLYDRFFETCEYALSNGLNISFSSNGILIPENIESIKRLKRYNRMVRVGISLDGYTPEMHSHFRPKETFEIAVDAIKLLQKADVALNVLCVLHKENIKKMPEFLKFVSSLNVSDVRLFPLIPLGRGKNYIDEMYTPDEFYNLLKEKLKWDMLFNNIGLHMPWEFLLSSPENRHPSPCEAGYLRLWMKSNGDMYPCAFMPDLIVGNIYQNSIIDTWLKSTPMRKLRDPNLLKGTCSNCDYREGCRGGCRGFAQFLEGDFLCSDPYCPLVNQKSFK